MPAVFFSVLLYVLTRNMPLSKLLALKTAVIGDFGLLTDGLTHIHISRTLVHGACDLTNIKLTAIFGVYQHEISGRSHILLMSLRGCTDLFRFGVRTQVKAESIERYKD
jgi:hypothetical protein